jgi:hypothetical protein
MNIEEGCRKVGVVDGVAVREDRKTSNHKQVERSRSGLRYSCPLLLTITEEGL